MKDVREGLLIFVADEYPTTAKWNLLPPEFWDSF